VQAGRDAAGRRPTGRRLFLVLACTRSSWAASHGASLAAARPTHGPLTRWHDRARQSGTLGPGDLQPSDLAGWTPSWQMGEVVVDVVVDVLVQHQDGNDAVDGCPEGRTRVRGRCSIPYNA
jgi:hypothetical protein